MHETKCANGAKRRVKMRQLFYKQKHVQDCLQRIAKIDTGRIILPVIGG